ncbi:hypothetical protein GCM10009827_069060 [Dactylosporangium maewongense]|uniref:Uncharacterized protein n=1 Tax=Dactylosporangium maewongense TaxID=634393 RepID=A0ABN2BGC1_9ACTN
MTEQEVGAQTPRLQQPVHRDLNREQRRLRPLRLIQPRIIHLDERAHLVIRRGEHRERLVETATHPRPLRTLTGEQHRVSAGGDLPADDRVVQQDGPVIECGPAGGEGVADVDGVESCHGPQPVDLCVEGVGGVPGERPRYHRQRRRSVGRDWCGRLLQDHVGVRAGDTERRHPGAARAVGVRPGPGLGEQPNLARGPVHVGRGGGDVEGAGQGAVLEREDHLDDPGDAGGGLGVAEVGLHRPEPQRLVAALPVGGEQRLRLDRVAEARAGAVRLDDVDLGGGYPGGGERGADDPLLRGTVRGRQTVGGAVLVDGGAAHDGEDRVAVGDGVRQPLQEQDADALAPAGAVGVVGERLAAAVDGQAALPGELDEHARGRHDGDAAGQGEPALAAAQRLRRQVHGDERRGARGVDGDRGTFEPERVRQPPGDDAGGVAGAEVAPDVLLGVGEEVQVLLAVGADEHAGGGAAHGPRVEACAFEHLPRCLQQQSLLRVHRQGLARRDAEERGVEPGGVVQEPADPGVGAARPVGVVVEERVEVPATVGREVTDRVPAVHQQLPQVLRRRDASGEPAAHRHDRDGLLLCGFQLPQPQPGLVEVSGHPFQIVPEFVLVHDNPTRRPGLTS